MSTSSGPFRVPANSAEPGLGGPVLALSAVFVAGLACVGLIVAVSEPTGDAPTAVVQVDQPEAAPADPEKPTQEAPARATSTQPYVAPGGASPLPKHGEPEAPPIPPTRLIDDQALNAPPPRASTLPAPDGPVPWDEAHKYLGQVITVKGTVIDTNNIGNICFLNYHADWQDKFYIAMFKEAFELLPDPPEVYYLDKTLLVTGKVTMHRDRPQIEVHDVSQIELVE